MGRGQGAAKSPPHTGRSRSKGWCGPERPQRFSPPPCPGAQRPPQPAAGSCPRCWRRRGCAPGPRSARAAMRVCRSLSVCCAAGRSGPCRPCSPGRPHPLCYGFSPFLGPGRAPQSTKRNRTAEPNTCQSGFLLHPLRCRLVSPRLARRRPLIMRQALSCGPEEILLRWAFPTGRHRQRGGGHISTDAP